MLFEILYLFLAVIVLPFMIILICYNTTLWGLRQVFAATNIIVGFILQIAPEVQFFEIHREGVEIPCD